MSEMNLFEAIERRGSIRSFKDEPIDKDVLLKIAKAGTYSATARNNQTRRFTIVTNPDLIRELAHVIGVGIDRADYDLYHPAAVILVSTTKYNKNAGVEIGLASQNMWLAATALGIGMAWTNQMRDVTNYKNVRQVLDKLDIPGDHICLNALVLGIPNTMAEPKAREEVIKFVE